MTASDALPADPFDSPLWDVMVENHLKGHPVVFDKGVKVGVPPVTEDQTQIPVSVDARALGPVDEVVVLGDLNTFPLTLKVKPKKVPAYFAFRMRLEQGSVIRAAALKDGRWHVGAQYLDAAGGGCSTPPVTEQLVDWDHLGQMRAKIWRESADVLRMRVRILHPMDTGLHKEPLFYIDNMTFKDAQGDVLAVLEPHEPIAKDPTFTLLIPDPKRGDHVEVSAHDIDGHNYTAKVPLVRTAAVTPTIKEGRL